MNKPDDKPFDMSLDKESPLVPFDESNGKESATVSEVNSHSWIMTDLVAPFFIANVLFWPFFIVIGWFGIKNTTDPLGAILLWLLAALFGVAIVGGIYGWFVGARYLSAEGLARQSDVRLAIRRAKESRRTLVVLQFLYFPACVFGGCTGFATLSGLFG